MGRKLLFPPVFMALTRWLLPAMALLSLAVAGALLAGGAQPALGHGDGSPAACSAPDATGVNPGDSGSSSTFTFTFDAPSGSIVTGVCIKSGSHMFGGNGHSDVLGNGTFEDGCYTVSGVSASQVVVTRNGSGSDCQAISHLDFIVSSAGSATPTPTPTAAPGATATPTPTPAAAVAGAVATPTVAVAGARALPATGGSPDSGEWGGLLLLAGIAAVVLGSGAVVVARGRKSQQ